MRPRFGPAHRCALHEFNGRAKPLDASGGVSHSKLGNDTPTSKRHRT
jgi:hypothetical protein